MKIPSKNMPRLEEVMKRLKEIRENPTGTQEELEEQERLREEKSNLMFRRFPDNPKPAAKKRTQSPKQTD